LTATAAGQIYASERRWTFRPWIGSIPYIVRLRDQRSPILKSVL